MADVNIDKLIDINALTTYNTQLHTDLGSDTIAHKSETAAANGTYFLYVFDGVNLKPLDLQVIKKDNKYTFSHYDALDQITVNTLYNITLTSGLTASYLGTNSFSCYSGTITNSPSSKTSITNKQYVDDQDSALNISIAAVSTNLSSMYVATSDTIEPSE